MQAQEQMMLEMQTCGVVIFGWRYVQAVVCLFGCRAIDREAPSQTPTHECDFVFETHWAYTSGNRRVCASQCVHILLDKFSMRSDLHLLSSALKLHLPDLQRTTL